MVSLKTDAVPVHTFGDAWDALGSNLNDVYGFTTEGMHGIGYDRLPGAV